MRTGEYEALVRTLPEAVRELACVLGGRTVAVIGGVNKTSAVGEWMRGERVPRGADAEQRLRLALQVVLILRERGLDDATIRAWMLGIHWRLKDESPIALIARGALDKVSKLVLADAREYVQTLS